MGVMDKILNGLKIGEDEAGDFYDGEDDGFYEDGGNDVFRKTPVGKDDPNIEVPSEKLVKNSPKPSLVRGKSKMVNSNGMEVCVIKPTSVEDAREITETLLGNRTVVLNLEGIDVDIAQRIIDFTSGSCFAINGNLQKISRYIFIITPATVDISGDFQDILGGGFDDSLSHSGPQSLS
ncbi:MAG: cell division protein SepF [Lachnospiraceae bacterium]|nr:cell division protein SepF [Lachnospiraceae bacterium]